jgi:tRNA(Ile)-lysidine synthase
MIRSTESPDLELLYKVNNTIINRNLLKSSERILVAVSGGQDSMCIIKTLLELQKKWAWHVGMIHCDHRWDSVSQSQAQHVASLAFSMGIDYYQPVILQSKKKENYARNWRYQMMQKIAIQYNYTSIITAHNASDRIETIMYNILRGTGVQGLQSLNWKRCLNHFVYMPSPKYSHTYRIVWQKLQYYKTDCRIFLPMTNASLKIIRPFLDIPRTDLSFFFRHWEVPSWPDLSNHEIFMRRNRVRHRLLPYLRLFFNLSVDQALGRFSEIVCSENFYFGNITNIILAKVVIQIKINISNVYACTIHIELLRSLPVAYQRRILKSFIYQEKKIHLSFRYLEHIRLYALFSKNDRQTKSCLHLPGRTKLFIINKVLLYLY